MPIYEYDCSKCGETIEVIQKISDPVLKKHKGCGGSLTKLISASGFQFKGTGWYVTDYARKSQPGSDSSSEKTDGAKSDGASKASSKESKPSGASSSSSKKIK